MREEQAPPLPMTGMRDQIRGRFVNRPYASGGHAGRRGRRPLRCAMTRGTAPLYHVLRTRHRRQSPVSWLARPMGCGRRDVKPRPTHPMATQEKPPLGAALSFFGIVLFDLEREQPELFAAVCGQRHEPQGLNAPIHTVPDKSLVIIHHVYAELLT